MLIDRQNILGEIETARKGRKLVCFLTFDRESQPVVPGLNLNFSSGTKEALFRVLKETYEDSKGIDVLLYTRGGDTNAVWPIVSIIREFDPDFEVLIPFRCHSAGTLVALGARRILMSPLAELSPIDPTTGNQFNPLDPVNNTQRLGISVEDVRAYRDFVLRQFGTLNDGAVDKETEDLAKPFGPYLIELISKVHPLALGNVDRVHQQIRRLAKQLLELHDTAGKEVSQAVDALTVKFYSHMHMINRFEARDILGEERVVHAPAALSSLLDKLLRQYEDDFNLRKPFFLAKCLGAKLSHDARFAGGVIESRTWAYIHATSARLGQLSKTPANVQIQLPVGQEMPLIPGLPREYTVDVTSQAWEHNTEPKGVTT